MTRAFTVGLCVFAALVVSPLLAAWTTALCADIREGWWRPRPTPRATKLLVAAASMALAALAGLYSPPTAWWLFATAGAVLAVVDARTRLLPSRLIYPLAAAELITLTTVAVLSHDLSQVGRALLASAVVGAGWFAIAFCSPDSLGLGDVRLAAVVGGLLGWRGWRQVLVGQLGIWLLAALLAVGLAAAHRSASVRGTTIPLGLPLVLAPLLVAHG